MFARELLNILKKSQHFAEDSKFIHKRCLKVIILFKKTFDYNLKLYPKPVKNRNRLSTILSPTGEAKI